MSMLFDPAHLHQPHRAGEIIVVGFAGGGGSCEGIRQALGREPDEALNHDPEAVAMHTANHPTTRHWCQNIWQAPPAEVAAGRPIGLAWFSPDCKHFSKAKGAAPRARNIRDLAWVVVAYAKLPQHLRPRVIKVENVEEFLTWGPLLESGQPDPARRGETFRQWVAELRRLGYRVEWRELRACDYGAPTIRKRLFVVARCDGRPIVWPEPTHGRPGSPEVLAGRRRPWITAADIIDWTLPCPSIFTRARPLAEATLARIFAGLKRYVLEHADPFIIPVTHQGDSRVHGVDEPLRTVTTAQRGEFALVAPYFAGCGGRAGQSPPRAPSAPMGTLTAKADGVVVAPVLSRYHGRSVGGPATDPLPTLETRDTVALVAPWMVQQNTGVVGHDARSPVSTIVQTGSHQMVASSHLVKLYGTCRHGQAVDEPLPTITAGGSHIGEVRAFLTKYYGQGGQDQDCRDPLHTVPTKARFGLVTVAGEDWQVVDIGLRMLTPRELFRAQGFPDSYIIDVGVDGKPLSKASQIRMAGNSVCPPIAAALVGANVPELAHVPDEVAA